MCRVVGQYGYNVLLGSSVCYNVVTNLVNNRLGGRWRWRRIPVGFGMYGCGEGRELGRGLQWRGGSGRSLDGGHGLWGRRGCGGHRGSRRCWGRGSGLVYAWHGDVYDVATFTRRFAVLFRLLEMINRYTLYYAHYQNYTYKSRMKE